MKNNTLQICIWILGILAFLGNLFVIIWRIIDKEENKVNCFLLTNLAVADMFMGVYLLTIAILLWTSGGKGSTLNMTRNGYLEWDVKL